MYKLRARRFEEDLVSSGVADAFGDVAAGVRAIRFDDRRNGYLNGDGGLIGDAAMSVLRYDATGMSINIPDAAYINYEKALSGTVSLVHNDNELSCRNGIATISRQGSFDLHFIPDEQTVRGIAVSLTLDALDRFLATGNEERDGPVGYEIIENSCASGVDGNLIDFTDYVLGHFELFRHEARNKLGQLAEALLMEIFVQLLRDIGSLKLRSAATGPEMMVVKRAEDYMHAHFGDSITIADVAAAVGVSLRKLQMSFRKLRDMTPRRCLSSIRLANARRMLLNRPTSTITAIANECGIMHSGRFSLAYRREYGEYPSETLRRSRWQ